MKKRIFNFCLMALAISLFTACSEDEGTDVGNDSQPVVTLYNYIAEVPYDSDCDAFVRVVANSATAEAYALAESKEAKENRVAELGEAGYTDYVIENGEKLEDIKGASYQDKVFTHLINENVITVVAVNGGAKNAAEISFTGLNWVTVAEGTYSFGVPNIKAIYAESVNTAIQYRADNPTSYRVKNLFGPGKHLTFTRTNMVTEDGGHICRIAPQETSLSFGSYGGVNVRDVATWLENDNLLDNVLYDNGYFYAWVQYYVSAGNLGYEYDEFVPAE